MLNISQRRRQNRTLECNNRLAEHRNLQNLAPIQRFNSKPNKIKFGVWNAQSIKKKSGSICDLVISKHLDILAFTETWLSADFYGNNTMAEILNTLKDFEFHQVPRIDRSGGGVGILLRKAFKVTRNDSIPLPAMEYMDLTISHGTSSIRPVTIYRPPSSKKNRSTPEAFFTDFSMLPETLTLVSDYLLLTGDFNFHMDKENDASVNVFKDLL